MSNEKIIYRPTGCLALSELPHEPQIRVGLQSPPFGGKTTAALTFPNPVVLSFDQKLGAHHHRSDVIEVPFWDGFFVDKIVKRDGLQSPPNRKDALLKWLGTEAIKLTRDQTLVIDGSTGIQTSFHVQYNLNPVITKSGEIDGFAEWKFKAQYFGELVSMIKALKCHVVYICHESPDRDKKGELTGGVRPLLTGQFGDELASHFTDFFRSITVPKPSAEKYEDFKKKIAGGSDSFAKELIASTPEDHETIYLWRTQSDQYVKCGTSSMFNAPKFIIANYSSFARYRKQTNTTK